jgi:hypothetical protein
MFMDFITTLVTFALGWFIGQYILLYRMRGELKKIATNLNIDLETGKPKIPTCVIEEDANQYYLYDHATQAFLCQAPSLEGLAKELNSTKKISMAIAVRMRGETAEGFLFKDGKIEPVRDQ